MVPSHKRATPREAVILSLASTHPHPHPSPLKSQSAKSTLPTPQAPPSTALNNPEPPHINLHQAAMFFKTFRSKSTSKSTNDDSLCATSTDSRSQCTCHSKGNMADPKGMQTTVTSSIDTERTADEAADFQKFLEKAKKDEERAEQKKLRELQEAERRRREVNLSPWAGRM